MNGRTIEHPDIGEKITFVRTSAETSGEMTEFIVELAPGGRNPPHFHTRFSESFTPLEGAVLVRLGDERRLVRPGTVATAGPGMVHSVSNPSSEPITFRVEVRPGQPGLERFAQIAYGLARDGLATRSGLPRKLSHLSVLMEMGDVEIPGPVFRLISPILGWLRRRARERGVEAALIDRYCVL